MEFNIFSILDLNVRIIRGFSSFYQFMVENTIGGYSLIEVMLGVGILAFSGWIIVKWVVPLG